MFHELLAEYLVRSENVDIYFFWQRTGARKNENNSFGKGKSLYVMKNHTAYIHATTCAAWLYLMTNLRGQEEYSTRPVDLKGGKLKERTGHALNGVNAVIQK